jgi:hypothetical protein
MLLGYSWRYLPAALLSRRSRKSARFVSTWTTSRQLSRYRHVLSRRVVARRRRTGDERQLSACLHRGTRRSSKRESKRRRRFDAERKMPMFQPQFAIARETTEMVLRRLEGLPPSTRTELLHACAQDCVHDTDQWRVSSPTTRELDVFAKRLFVLHVEVTKLERGAAVAR